MLLLVLRLSTTETCTAPAQFNQSITILLVTVENKSLLIHEKNWQHANILVHFYYLQGEWPGGPASAISLT